MDLAQRGGHDLDLRDAFSTTWSIMPKNALGSSLDLAATSGPAMPSPFCRSSSLPTSTSTFFDDAVQHRHGALLAARDVPELGAVVQIEGDDRAGRLGRLHAFDNHFGGGSRKRREDAAAVEPAHAARENRLPVEIARLQAAPPLRSQRL